MNKIIKDRRDCYNTIFTPNSKCKITKNNVDMVYTILNMYKNSYTQQEYNELLKLINQILNEDKSN